MLQSYYSLAMIIDFHFNGSICYMQSQFISAIPLVLICGQDHCLH